MDVSAVHNGSDASEREESADVEKELPTPGQYSGVALLVVRTVVTVATGRPAILLR